MIIDGSINSDKTDMLINEYVKLVNANVPVSKILVLVQNSSLKNHFIDEVLERTSVDVLEKMNVYSFSSLVYNTVSENWSFLENRNKFDNPVLLPNLAGLEISQFILKDILKEIPFKGYNSKKSLLHQLFRRYSLIVQNNLSDTEIEERSKILKESFGDDAKLALKKLLAKTLELRDFDYLRQILLFNFIYKNSKYFSEIEYLIVDDGDEITPVCFDFIKYLKPQLKDIFIAYDSKGSSRCGYLSADRNSVWEFEKLFQQQAKFIDTKTKLKYDAATIYDNVINNKCNKLEYFSLKSPSKRAKMIDIATETIKNLLKKNIKPNEIAIITPIIDDMLKFSLKQNLNTELVFLSGNEKLIQNKIVQAVLTIIKLNSDLKSTLTEFDIRVILTNFLNIPIRYCKKILEEFDIQKNLPKFNFNDEEFDEKYNNLLELVDRLSCSCQKLSEQACDIYETLVEYKNTNKNEINKFKFFIKQLREFENIFKNDFHKRQNDIIIQIENSIIAENPYSTLTINDNELVIATPQKIIDNQIKTKYQIWLDISSNEWIKSDTGPLYNAWVFQKGWDKPEYTIDDNIKLSQEKTARILRKLVLCANEFIYVYSSLFDSNGTENFGGIENYINFQTDINNEAQTQKPIIPRKDQAPVLEYKNGKMAISAVPGAGKTTILLALILILLQREVNPENIFVLTYMESAARNFRERIKNIKQDSTKIPNISTIHGLALRILKENGNYERLGLNQDFEICDDSQRLRIINDISAKMKLKQREAEDFNRGISIYKLQCGNTKIDTLNLKKFNEFYQTYSTILQSQSLIDYDDMLISSVKLLKENNDILEYYQNICHYIIEDEAQDSSSVQQELINLLSSKHKNLIRCGDINQAITTTFSNADVAGFRKFIKESNAVSMNCSQRCTKDVWELANTLVKYAMTNPDMQNAFYEIFMQPVIGKNPEEHNGVTTKIFDTPNEEKQFILKTIKNALTQNPKATIGILLRNNFQVVQWLDIIKDSGLKSITRSECLEQKSIFKVIFAILKIILNPFDNKNIAENYEILAQTGLYPQRLGIQIGNMEKSFIEESCDNILDANLCQFYWDINYWLSMPHLPVEELAIKIGTYYFSSEIEKSNVYLISTLIKRICANNKNLDYILERLNELAKKSNLSGFKFFSQEDENDSEYFEGKVQIMTLHKSKGDEFDLVFIPEITEKNLTLNMDDIKLKSENFMESIRQINPNYIAKTENDLKREILEENLRLLYVAITRAKRKLYMTVSRKSQSFGKTVENKINTIFTEIIGGVNV